MGILAVEPGGRFRNFDRNAVAVSAARAFPQASVRCSPRQAQAHALRAFLDVQAALADCEGDGRADREPGGG